MKIVFRNLVSIIRKFKLAWLMNFAGIAAALTALMFVGMQISYENSFDDNHSNAERIFRISQDVERPFNVILARGVIETIGHISPKVEAYAAEMDFFDLNYIEVEINGQKHEFNEYTIGIDSGYAKMFDFDLVCGDLKTLATKGNALISENTAKKMFGNSEALGKTLKLNEDWGTDNGEITITGVYKDFPSNTQTKNAIFFSLNDVLIDDNQCRNFIGWVMLSSPNDKAEIETLINKNEACGVQGMPPYYLEPLKDVYYNNENDAGFVKSGSAKSTAMLAVIALIVLLISAVNQTNFNTALIPKRIRSINTQKVLGSSISRLRLQLFAESIIIGLLTWLTALLMVKLLNNTWLTSFLVPDDLTISSNLGVCLFVGLISLIINVLSNIYPILKLTSVNPALVLKGSYGRSFSGQKLRNFLLVFQYFSAICFISIAVCIWLQIRYMENAHFILRDNQIAVFKTNRQFGQKFELALQKLKENSAIENVALSSQLIGGSDAFNTRYYIFNSDTLYFNSINCTSEILDVFDIPLIEGDGFVGIRDSEVSNYDYKNDCVVSAEIFSKFKYNIGDTVYGMFGAIRGVIDKGLRITSFRKEIMPLALGLAHAEYLNFCYVKIAKGSNLKTALTHIENVVSEIVPEMPLEITFYDKIFENLYKKEINTSATTVFMAILALLISIIGVFGMVTFDSEYRRNEIALRRVFGASTDDIIKKINAKYLIMIFAGFVLSLPVTLYVITLWQQNFVEKAPLPWWMFPVVVLLVTVVTCAIVTVQSAKTVYGNPVEGLKKE